MRLDRLKIASEHSIFSMTHLLLALCVFLFIGIHFQEAILVKQKGELAAQMAIVPIAQKLLFDNAPEMQATEAFIQNHDLRQYDSLEKLPQKDLRELHAIENMPTWKGLYGLWMDKREGKQEPLKNVTLFHDIRQGEVWRLFTPALLHFNFLHILFNMAWLWMLGKQIEYRLGKFKLLILTIIIGVVSNVAQYLMTGPLFLGYSGVVMGMAGFIWMRQKKAPWEGYPLPKSTALFLLFFVLAIVVLEVGAFILQMTKVLNITPNIANTAHIVGGLVGLGLAKIPYFERRIEVS